MTNRRLIYSIALLTFGFSSSFANSDGQLKKATAYDIVSASAPFKCHRPTDYFGKKKVSLALKNKTRHILDSLATSVPSDSGIVFGESVSRHEFGIDGGIFYSSDSSAFAFYRKDESLVEMTRLGRYPMNGSPSERISLGIYDFIKKNVIYLDTSEFSDDQYLTCTTWHPDGKSIFVQVLDRPQKNLKLNRYSSDNGRLINTVLQEHSDTWVEPSYPLYWISASSHLCIYTTDNRDGCQQLYLLDISRNTIRRLAPGFDFPMTYVGNDGKFVYFTSTGGVPVNQYLYKVSLNNGAVTNLTPENGWHSIQMACDCKCFLDTYETLDTPPCATLRSIKGKVIRTIMDSVNPTVGYAMPEITLDTVSTADGSDINWYRLVKPTEFDTSAKYPLILYVYGGPHSQMVKNTFLANLRWWELYAAQNGFAILVLDGRGTLGHNAAYEHCIYRQCGICEAQDQIKALERVMKLPWVDKDRIGIYGWSYGGFMSLSLATSYPDIFKLCVAGGPVIDWRWYEVMYGERYMGNSFEDSDPFDAVSLIGKSSGLRAKTLIIHGGKDDTVLPCQSAAFVQECINRGIPIDYFIYPEARHNMRGQDRVHLVEKITGYFVNNL